MLDVHVVCIEVLSVELDAVEDYKIWQLYCNYRSLFPSLRENYIYVLAQHRFSDTYLFSE